MNKSPRSKKAFDIQPDERASLLVFIVIIAANAISLEGTYVIATSGFLKNLRVEQFPLLGLVDMAILLVVSGFYALLIDRVPRLKFVQGMLISLAFLHLTFRLLFAYDVPTWLTYPGLYLIAEQQYILFPLAFWVLANDRFSVAQAKRLFPLIATGGLVGQIIGSGLAGGSARFFESRDIHPSELLILNALLFLMAFVLLALTAKNVTLATRQGTSTFKIRDVLETGSDFVRNVPSFRLLAVSMVAVGFILAVIEYHFLFTSDQAFKDIADFQTFYGIYRMTLPLSTLVLQGLLAGRVLQQAGLKNTFPIMPATLFAAVGTMLVIPNVVGGAIGRFLARLARNSIDRPAHQTLQGLIPEERRGRVSTFMSSYLYVAGDFLGSGMLALIIFAASRGWLVSNYSFYVYLGITLFVTALAFYMTWKMRAVYDSSLLDWRLARRRRGGGASVSSKLDDLIGS
ncbi:MAG TPA: Npt1/Npt2 family nucleotide transporter [Anaerolineales bacterium]|nr:Npt1/Npt2 family nucleotide transporter [Anaerolineales bacterium]